MPGSEGVRLLVVSHAAVIPLNQEPFSALGELGMDVTVVAPAKLRTDIRGTVEFEPLDGFAGRLVPLPVRIGGYRRLLGGQRGVHLLMYKGLVRLIRDERPDVIFVEEQPYSLAAGQVVRARRRTGIPYVVHDNQNIARRLPSPFARIQTRVYATASGMTVRNDVAARIAEDRGFSGPIRTLPHVVDPARFSGATRESSRRNVVGYVGRLVPEKGIGDLIDAMARVRREVADASLLVIGDGPARSQLEDRASSLGVPAGFCGALSHDDVPPRYASMDVVAIPSRTTETWKEQFGRIVIEANAAGVPVIASDSGELPRTVAATGGGVVVPEGDVGALAASITALLRDEPRRRALGAAGREAVLASFTPAAIARDLAAFLTEVARS